MEGSINVFLDSTVQVIELISTSILLVGFVKTLLFFLQSEWRSLRGEKTPPILPLLRRQLGMYILLGLDFYIVSDIIHSMIQPNWNQLLNLGIIVLLRTTIGFFLGREIAEIDKTELSQHT